MIGIGGPSSSGKTFSALRMARGIVGKEGKIYLADTEKKRALQYADYFDFMHGDFEPPFRPSAYLEAIHEAEKAGADILIIDSGSHMQEGIGGMLDWHEEILDKMAGNDFKKRDRMTFTAWIKPKSEYNKFVDALLRTKIHVIFCFRAREKTKMVKVSYGQEGKSKTEVVPQGWQPICPTGLNYELTALFMLPPNSEGKVDLKIDANKTILPFQSFVRDGDQISENMGARFAEWAGAQKKDANKKKEEAPAPKQEEPKPETETRRGYDAIFGTDGEIKTFETLEQWLAYHRKTLDIMNGPALRSFAKSSVPVFNAVESRGHKTEVEALRAEFRAKMEKQKGE